MVSNNEPKDIADPLELDMYSQKLFNFIISAKIIRNGHPILQKAIDYAQKSIKKGFLINDRIQWTEFETVLAFDASASNGPIKSDISKEYKSQIETKRVLWKRLP